MKGNDQGIPLANLLRWARDQGKRWTPGRDGTMILNLLGGRYEATAKPSDQAPTHWPLGTYPGLGMTATKVPDEWPTVEVTPTRIT